MEHLSLPLRVLLCAPRPTALAASPSRAATEALYDALEAQGDQVEAEWLWPATLEALRARLSASDKPSIGVLCLDAAVVEAEQGPTLGLDADAGVGQASSMEALGAILRGGGLRLLILCTPAERAEEPNPGLAAALATASGVSVLYPSGALVPERLQRAMRSFFAALLAGQPPSRAVVEARRSLGRRKIPTTVETQAIAFQPVGADLPVVQVAPQGNQGVSRIVRFPSPDLSPAWRRLAAQPEPGGLPLEPAQGFSGRARELVALEEALRGDRGNGVVLVHGYEGMGKTTLIAHAARWLARTGRFSRVAYTSFAHGGHVESALYDLGMRALGEAFSPGEDSAAQIEQALVQTPTLVIWDGLEALLAGGEFALEAEGLQSLLQLGARLARAGGSRLCVICETPNIPDPAYSEWNVALSLALGGLAEADAIDLVASLRAGAEPTWPAGGPTAELVNALGGHPLALCVTPRLFLGRTPAEIMANLEEILPGLRTGEARLRNGALDLVMAALLRTLGNDFGPELSNMGLFAGGFMEPLLSTITELREPAWKVAKKRLVEMRLAYEETVPGLNAPLIRCAAALLQRLNRRITAEQRLTLELKYCGGYVGLIKWLAQNMERSPAAIKTLAHCELPNLRRTFRLLLEREDLDTAAEFSQNLVYVLDQLHYVKERDQAQARLQQAATQAAPEEGPLGRPGVRFLLAMGERLFSAGRVAEAGAVLQGLVQRMESEGGITYSGDEAALDLGVVLHRLGRCAQTMGNIPAAMELYARAQDALIRVQTEIADRDLLALYEDLGAVSVARGWLDQATEAYLAGLTFAEKLLDQHAAGRLNAQLGNIAMLRDDLAQARMYYQTAINHLVTTADVAAEAGAWSQVGTCALRMKDLAEAERCYTEALKLARKAEQVALQGQVMMQLAQVAEEAGRPADAEAKYGEALALYREHDIQPAVVSAEVALATLLLREGQFEPANAHAKAARAIVDEVGGAAHPWEVHALLQRIAAAEGDAQAEATWRARAQESFAASDEAEQVLRPWQLVIRGVARACRGETMDAETVEFLEKLESTQAWQQLAATLWRVLGGERGIELAEPLDYVDALVVRRVLQAIEAPPEDEAADAEDTTQEQQDDASDSV